jgi:hypothetical protein
MEKNGGSQMKKELMKGIREEDRLDGQSPSPSQAKDRKSILKDIEQKAIDVETKQDNKSQFLKEKSGGQDVGRQSLTTQFKDGQRDSKLILQPLEASDLMSKNDLEKSAKLGSEPHLSNSQTGKPLFRK